LKIVKIGLPGTGESNVDLDFRFQWIRCANVSICSQNLHPDWCRKLSGVCDCILHVICICSLFCPFIWKLDGMAFPQNTHIIWASVVCSANMFQLFLFLCCQLFWFKDVVMTAFAVFCMLMLK